MSTHKGTTVTVVRTSQSGDPGLHPAATLANMRLVSLPPPAPIIQSFLVNTTVMPVPTQGMLYSAPTTEIV